MEKSPLAGVRVADFSWAWAGPYTTLLLGFLGAEIIKIESRRRLDHSRLMSLTTGQSFQNLDASPIFCQLNLNKLGVTLNLSKPEGIELAKRIVAMSDIVMENFRPGVMEKLGLGYSVLKEIKPDLIMLSVSARGQKGPERHYVGYAPNFGALGGLSYLTGYYGGKPSTLVGSMDLRVGTWAVFAALSALVHRQRTGEGQYIDLSASEAISCLITDSIMEYTINGRIPSRMGNRDDIMAPHNCYRCQGEDRWVSIAVSTQEEWKALCGVMGNPQWSKDTKFSDPYQRWQNQEELDRRITEWTKTRTAEEVTELCQRVGVAAFPSYSNKDMFESPHLKERGFATEVTHPVVGKHTTINPPWKLGATPARITRQAPLIGEHNDYVFGELLGLSKEEIMKLTKEEVIY
jgi:benzylsuccinate CoA-transferase BbsF subunit